MDSKDVASPISDKSALPETPDARTVALLGAEAFARLQSLRVLLVGCGGVGGWCAEALVRSGIRHLTLVDDDVVKPSNLNRQLVATVSTLNQLKVDALRERLLAIRPEAEIVACPERFTAAAIADFDLAAYDVIIDAIDSVPDKAALIRAACSAPGFFISSMGAARRLDSTAVRTLRFSKVTGDGLARAVRQRFKKDALFPSRDFPCVCSLEQPLPSATLGSLMPVVATFGTTLAAACLTDSLPAVRTNG